jgi:uncharacterized protein involved in exopolysaccharide biosynthesis
MTKNLADELQRTARQALAGLQPVAQGDEFGGLPFRRLVAAVFRGRYLLFGTTCLGLLVGLFLAITTINTYVSEGRFQFTATGAERLRVDTASAAETSQEMMAAGATYILSNNDLLERVVKRLGPGRILQPYEPGKGEENGVKSLFFRIQRDWNMTREEDRTPEAALRYLKRTILVDAPRYSGMLVATCVANNPELAREILATWMDEAKRWHIETYDDSKSYDAAKKRFEDSKQALDTANKAMAEFLVRKAKVLSFDADKERLEVELGGANGRESDLRSAIKSMEEEIRGLKAMVDGPNALPLTVKMKVKQSSASQEAITRLEQDIVAKEVELRQLRSAVLNQDSSDVRRLTGTIKSMKEQREEMKRELASAPLVEEEVDNPLRRKAQEDLLTREGELSAGRARLEAAISLRTEKESELRRLIELEPEYSRLVADRLSADTDVHATEALWKQAQEKRVLGEGNFSSLKPIQTASLPLEKEGPNRAKLILGAFAVGLFLGLGVLVLRALPDDVVRTRDDLERIEGLAVIGVMPSLDGKNLRRHVALREQGW